MEKFLIVLHGSPKKEANTWDQFLSLLAATFGRPREDFALAFLQFGEPDVKSALEALIKKGAKRIIVHPFFLSAGLHVTKDIPEILEEVKREIPEVEIIYTKPLGIHEKLAEIVKERIEEMGVKRGVDIERKSFEIIEKEIDLSNFSPEEKVIVKRVIHAT
ncbi:MAG: precorrin-8X methylmutase, partial [Caldimicrobium sp.]